MEKTKSLLIIGGGIAGFTCLETVLKSVEEYGYSNPFCSVKLISETRLIKRITNYQVKGRNIETFDVDNTEFDDVYSTLPAGTNLVCGTVEFINTQEKTVTYTTYENGLKLRVEEKYDILCLCHGSKPKLLNYIGRRQEIDSRIVVIRDTSSVDELRRKLNKCTRVCIVGNGGISLELVSKIKGCHKTWIIRDASIGSPYFDSGAAKFLLEGKVTTLLGNASSQTYTSTNTRDKKQSTTYGPALGPNWCSSQLEGSGFHDDLLDLIYEDEVTEIKFNEENVENLLQIITRKGKSLNCDLVVSAIGVEPNNITIQAGLLKKSTVTGGIVVDQEMRTSIPDVYAAGDVVSCEKWSNNDLWFQMPLWTQARQMGYYTARCIVDHLHEQDPSIYFNFDCFSHCTFFLGFKVVLLGRYNDHSFPNEGDRVEVLVNVQPKTSYCKVITRNEKIIGAVLIGDTDLDETLENLIYNRTDISSYKNELLDGVVDIVDYFD